LAESRNSFIYFVSPLGYSPCALERSTRRTKDYNRGVRKLSYS
jgi:hypothetical protein